MRSKKILVTGITGFVGSELAKKLLRQGHEVYGFSRNDRFSKNKVEGVTYVKGDLEDRKSINRALWKCKPEILVHLAAYTPVRFSFSKPGEYTMNYTGTMNLVEECISYRKLEQFVKASSAEVYGPLPTQSHIITEETCPSPLSPYSISKYAAELYVRYAEHRGLTWTVLRSTNTYGRPMELPEEAKGYFVEKLVIGMLQRENISFDGFPESQRRWMHVDDHVGGYVSVIGDSRAYNQIFNVSTDDMFSLGDLAEMVRNKTCYDGTISWGTAPRPIDPNFLDTHWRKISQMLGYHPSVRIRIGLSSTIEYWRDKLSEQKVVG